MTHLDIGDEDIERAIEGDSARAGSACPRLSDSGASSSRRNERGACRASPRPSFGPASWSGATPSAWPTWRSWRRRRPTPSTRWPRSRRPSPQRASSSSAMRASSSSTSRSRGTSRRPSTARRLCGDCSRTRRDFSGAAGRGLGDARVSRRGGAAPAARRSRAGARAWGRLALLEPCLRTARSRRRPGLGEAVPRLRAGAAARAAGPGTDNLGAGRAGRKAVFRRALFGRSPTRARARARR